jgi:hypothetical protein
MTFQIVIAWTEDSAEWDGAPYAADLGERPTMRPTRLAKAAMWLRQGTEVDVEKARAYAAKDGHRVLTFPQSERDPLGAAKAAVLRGVSHT